jgi:hypothetical protein
MYHAMPEKAAIVMAMGKFFLMSAISNSTMMGKV